MIRAIENTETTQVSRPASNIEPATAAGKTFKSVLASHKATAHNRHKDPIEAPRGEVWRPVRGNDQYAKITEGPRAGQYINLSRGARRGETFTVEKQDGVRVHVYTRPDGTKKIVEAAKDSGKIPGHGQHGAHAAREIPRGETWAPVEGVSNYADILGGRRNGWYVNTSGGDRDGMAFHIVEKHGKTYHVYGTGKHKQMVEVAGEPPKKHETKATGDAETKGTGGADAKPDKTSTPRAEGEAGGAVAPD